MKKLLFYLCALFAALNALAYDFEVDGIYYKVKSEVIISNSKPLKNEWVVVTYKTPDYKSYAGEINIPAIVESKSAKYPVRSIDASAFRYCSGLISITIPNSVTSIGNYAFDGCSGLTSITIPNSVKSIGNYAFDGCSGLASVNITDLSKWCQISFGNGSANPLSYAHKLVLNGTEVKDLVIPDDVTSIGNYAFYNCSGLTSVTIPNSVTSIRNYAFYNCSGLTSVTIPNSVTIIGNYAFYNCSGLTSVTIPNSVTSIRNYAFSGCSGLTSVTIGNSVTSIGPDAFFGCHGLTSLIVESGNPMYDSRENCNAIIETSTNTLIAGCQNTIIPNSVTSIGRGAFSGCGLTSVTIPNTVTNIGDYAFSYCTGLTSVNIPNSVTSIGGRAFYECSSLTSLTIPGSVTSIENNAFEGCYMLKEDFINNSDCRDENTWGLTLCDVETKDGLLVKEKIAVGCRPWAESVCVPNSVTSIGNYAFYECSSLTSITIPNSVTNIGESAFWKCSGLTSITIPNSVTSIGSSAFSGCSGLTSITIPNSVTSIGLDAFFGCHSLTSVSIPNSITKIEKSTFRYCLGLTSITIPNSVVSIGDDAFILCSSLTSVTIPNSVTSIGSDAFMGCNIETLYVDNNFCCSKNYFGSNLKEVKIGNSVTRIDDSAFSGCSHLTSVSIGAMVTGIGDYAFSGCSGLTSITIPNSVTSIGDGTFGGCSALKSLKLEGVNTTLPVDNDYKFNIYVHTPSQTYLYLLIQKFKNLYSIETGSKIEVNPQSYFSSVSGGYTRVRANFVNLMSGYDWATQLGTGGTLIPVADNSCVYKVKKAGTYTIYLYAKYKDSTNYLMEQIDVTTKDIESFIQNYRVTSSSITPNYSIVQELEDEGAADVRYNYMISGGAPMSGLDPNTEYSVFRYIHCDAFDKTFYDKVRTAPIVFTTAMAKVINVGNVIVAATTNVDEEEMNVGFEWRRQDWSELNPSNTASAPIYEGQMEGYIRNLYTGAQWKYRPYYKSNSGNYYYGEWMGFDPTNTSYFEPTVHTYGKIDVTGNTAVVKGYAMRGTDDILSQGFRYWMSVDANTRSMKAPSMNDIMTVEAKGQVMTAVLPGLEYETTYCYQAYVTTVEGTVEGEIRMFTTDDAPADISPIQINGTDEEKKIVGYYDINGRVLSSPTRGISIVRYTDGSSRCVMTR